MKVLAVNSSPRTEGESKTEIMMQHLVKGMQDAGADVEIVHLRQKKIRNCIGCFTCWTKTPGICLHKDDMTQELFPKWLASDLVVYATPLYHYTVNAALKTFIERTLPVLQPFFEEREGVTHHPLRHKLPAMVMLSVAGFPDDAVFQQLSSWTRFVFRESLVAEIYRAGAETLTVPFYKEKASEILEATEKAGREIVIDGRITPETLALVQQSMVDDKNSWFAMGNLMWKTCIAEGVTPKEFMAKGIPPRPDSLETFMMLLSIAFNPAAAGSLAAVIQFHFSGHVAGSCYFRIQDGCIEPSLGNAGQADLTISTPFSLWMDIMAGKADGQQAFMEQKYQVAGDIAILMQFKQLFQK